MRWKKFLSIAAVTLAVLSMTACATKTENTDDYSAFKESQLRSILVLPPINKTVEVLASHSVLSHATFPLSESAYYVIPVTLVAETFKENGLTEPTDIHATPIEKPHQIFGADAVLYINILEYGTVYKAVKSESLVSAHARLVDLKSGKTLWQGSATTSSEEGQNHQGSLVSLLVSAVVNQIIATASDRSHDIAGITTNRLLYAGHSGDILCGQRSPHFSDK